MTTYARIVGGFAVDVVTTPPALSEQFNAEWLAKQTFYPAPDGTLHGRTGVVNGDGSVTWGANPQSSAAPVNYVAVLRTGEADYRAAILAKSRALLRKGDVAGSQLLLNKIGE